MRLLFLLIGGAILVLLAYLSMLFAVPYLSPQSPVLKFWSGSKGFKEVKIGSGYFRLELATTTMAQAKGLSGRDGMPQDQGMMFIFDKPREYGFWMINMKFPLDIIWLNRNQVVYMLRDASPHSFPKVFRPTSPADSVIELNAGTADRIGLRVGDKLNF